MLRSNKADSSNKNIKNHLQQPQYNRTTNLQQQQQDHHHQWEEVKLGETIDDQSYHYRVGQGLSHQQQTIDEEECGKTLGSHYLRVGPSRSKSRGLYGAGGSGGEGDSITTMREMQVTEGLEPHSMGDYYEWMPSFHQNNYKANPLVIDKGNSKLNIKKGQQHSPNTGEIPKKKRLLEGSKTIIPENGEDEEYDHNNNSRV